MTIVTVGRAIATTLGVLLSCFLFLVAVCVILTAIVLAIVCARELYVYLKEELKNEIERSKAKV